MITIELPAGVVNAPSRKAKSANWRETNLVRWEEGALRPVGGWELIDYTSFASRCRASYKWSDNDGAQYIAYLCEEHCYVDIGGVLTDITPVGGIAGPADVDTGGYGDLLYSADAFGTPRSGRTRIIVKTPAYTLDNWGEQLLVMTSNDGRLLFWDPATPATPLAAVTGAPTGNRSFAVTPERHVMLFGINGVPAKFGWSDQEDYSNWDFASLVSKAGSYEVEPRSPIVAHIVMANGTLMFTNRAAYIIPWTGLPYVYQYSKIVECPAPFSAASLVEIPDGAIWASFNGFWIYNGVSIQAIPCPLWDWVRRQMNEVDTKYEATLIPVASKSEVWFFFAAEDSNVANRVVIYNYRDQIWSMGKATRTCGISYANEANPIMSDGWFVYRHEKGYSYMGSPELPWAETFTMNIASGANLMTIKQMLPEIIGGRDTVQFKFVKLMDPSEETEVMSPAKTIRANGYVDVRETARDFRMRVEMVGTRGWTMGPTNVDILGRGSK